MEKNFLKLAEKNCIVADAKTAAKRLNTVETRVFFGKALKDGMNGFVWYSIDNKNRPDDYIAVFDNSPEELMTNQASGFAVSPIMSDTGILHNGDFLFYRHHDKAIYSVQVIYSQRIANIFAKLCGFATPQFQLTILKRDNVKVPVWLVTDVYDGKIGFFPVVGADIAQLRDERGNVFPLSGFDVEHVMNGSEIMVHNMICQSELDAIEGLIIKLK